MIVKSIFRLNSKINYTHDNPIKTMIVGKLNIASKQLDVESKDMNVANKHLNVVN